MSWYWVFYWITVADSLSTILQTIAIITLIGTIITTIGLFFSANYVAEHAKSGGPEDQTYSYNEWVIWHRAWRRTFTFTFITCIITSIAWAMIPSKKDALVIVAGGAVGQFITSDSNTRQIPAEVAVLLRDKIRSEIKEINSASITDTLASKSKEELIKMIQEKK